MNNKKLYKIINEELSEFDFLNMDKFEKSQNYNSTISSKEFQTKLINDIIFNDNKNILNDNIQYIEFDKDSENTDFEYSKEFDYLFNGDKYPIYIFIEGDQTFLEDCSLIFFGKDGVKIDFSWIDKHEPLKKKLIQSLVGEYKNQ